MSLLENRSAGGILWTMTFLLPLQIRFPPFTLRNIFTAFTMVITVTDYELSQPVRSQSAKDD